MKVVENFIYHVEKISPTSSTSRQKFQHIDNVNLSPDQSSGMTRSFDVWWNSSDEIDEPSTFAERIAPHEFMIEYHYSKKFANPKTLQVLVLSDRHDTIKKLRHTDSFIGYDSDNQSDDIGIFDRKLIRDDLDRDSSPNSWTYRQYWRCTIREDE